MLAKFFQRLRKELQTIGQIQKMIVESERYTKSIGQVLDDKLHLAVQSVSWSGSTENAMWCLGSDSVSVSNPASPKANNDGIHKELSHSNFLPLFAMFRPVQDEPSDNVLGRHEHFITPE
jgi:hypothetical protein